VCYVGKDGSDESVMDRDETPQRVLEFGPPEIVVPDGASTRALRRAVLPILALESDGNMHAIGTCFVVSPTGNQALALTAKHNIDYILRIDGVRDVHVPTTPQEFRRMRPGRQTIKNVRMFVAYWTPYDRVVPCELLEVWAVHGGHDIAAVLLKIPERYNVRFEQRLKIDARGPRVGAQIRAIGYHDIKLTDPCTDEAGVIVRQSLGLPLKVVEGTVTHSYAPREHRLVETPCIELDCSFDPGMSGGPIFTIDDSGAIVAVAMITAGASYAPQGIGSLLYPALLTRLRADPILGVGTTPSLMDCIRRGLISDVAEADKHLRDDGSWSDTELTPVEFHDLDRLPEGGHVVAETDSTACQRPVEFLSADCARLGRVNQLNGDDSEFFLISAEACEILRCRSDPNGPPGNVMRFLRAETPYVWFQVGDACYRFFLFAIEGDRHPPVTILTDAHRIDNPDEMFAAQESQGSSGAES
jgi:hypothetical protein